MRGGGCVMRVRPAGWHRHINMICLACEPAVPPLITGACVRARPRQALEAELAVAHTSHAVREHAQLFIRQLVALFIT
jgi:hypothetical protein